MFLYKTCLPSLYWTFGIQCYGDGIEGEALNTIGVSSTGVTVKFHIHGCINSCLMIYVLNATYAVCFNVICNSISSFTMHDT